jgi:malate dehydrogenase (oxaloacetate-decarboxylating)(NADP+)
MDHAGFAMKQFDEKVTNLEKYTFLHTLQDTHEDLFFQLLTQHTTKLMPYVYTPTVGEACQNWGEIYRHAPRGLYINSHDSGSIEEILRSYPKKDIKVIVFTDGERVLGLGDQGINGMGIPIGKLALYVACGGISPSACLPVTIDVGTNRETYHEDPYYFGLKQPRDRSENYFELIEEFITSAQRVYGREVLLQFEDFGQANAFKLLDMWEDKATTFNDDLQGTAGVTLAGFISSLKLCGKKKVADHKIMFHGAGGAAIGIAELLCTAIMKETGCTREEARKSIHLVDSKGLVSDARTTSELKGRFAHHVPSDDASKPPMSLLDAVKAVKPTALVGVSGQGGAFDEQIVREMARNNDHPLIMALSNPTAMAECTSEQAYEWTDGKAVYASGSPMPAVSGRHGLLEPGQCNNAFIFPGLGLGAVVCGATKITDDDFYVAALELARTVDEEQLAKGTVFPSIADIRKVSLDIAAAVAANIVERGDSTMVLRAGDSWRDACERQQYDPSYSASVSEKWEEMVGEL